MIGGWIIGISSVPTLLLSLVGLPFSMFILTTVLMWHSDERVEKMIKLMLLMAIIVYSSLRVDISYLFP